MPTKGTLANMLRAGAFALSVVMTCRLTDLAEDVTKRMHDARQDTCIVVNEQSVVLGRVRLKDVKSSGASFVEDVMESGPSTFRPNVSLEEMVEYMTKRKMADALITTSDGILVGVLNRKEAKLVAPNGAD